MPGRHAEPLNVIVMKGKTHLTKGDKDRRKKAEIKFPTGKIKCPQYVKRDVVAYGKWKEIVTELKKADVARPVDAGSLARYCSAHSRFIDLSRRREMLTNREPFLPPEQAEITDEFEAHEGSKRAAAMMWKKVEFAFSTQAVLSLDKDINQTMAAILALEDRLYLNIRARTTNIIPQPEEKPEDPLERDGFRNV